MTGLDNRRFVEEMYRDLAHGAFDRMLDRLDDDIEWTETEGAPYAGTYHGLNEVAEVFARMARDWRSWRPVAQQIRSDGETVIVFGTATLEHARTGKRVRAPFVHRIELHDGKVQRFSDSVDGNVLREAMGIMER